MKIIILSLLGLSFVACSGVGSKTASVTPKRNIANTGLEEHVSTLPESPHKRSKSTKIALVDCYSAGKKTVKIAKKFIAIESHTYNKDNSFSVDGFPFLISNILKNDDGVFRSRNGRTLSAGAYLMATNKNIRVRYMCGSGSIEWFGDIATFYNRAKGFYRARGGFYGADMMLLEDDLIKQGLTRESIKDWDD